MNPLIGSPLPAPQRRGHAPRLCRTRLRRARRAGRKARSHYCWEGERNLWAVGKPAKRSFRLRGRTGALPQEEQEALPFQAPPSFHASIRAPRSFSARTSAEGSRFIRGSTTPPTPVCLAVSSLLRPRYDVSRLPPAVPDFSAGFRFVAPHGAPARLRLHRTTFPRRPSGWRRGCGQMTWSPDPR